jgi:hypothetical protein
MATQDGHDGELERLQQELLGYLVDGLATATVAGKRIALTQAVIDAIHETAWNSAREAAAQEHLRLKQLGDDLSRQIIAAGGIDHERLAQDIADRLRPRPEDKPPEPALFTRYGLLLAGLGLGLLLTVAGAVAGVHFAGTWTQANARASAATERAQALQRERTALCDAFHKHKLALVPLAQPGPAHVTNAPHNEAHNRAAAPAEPDSLPRFDQDELVPFCIVQP